MAAIEESAAPLPRGNLLRINNALAGVFAIFRKPGRAGGAPGRDNSRFSLLASILLIALLILLFAQSARLFWLVFAPLSTPDAPPPVLPVVAGADLTEAKSPFAKRDAEPVAIDEPVFAEVQETSLNMVLHGVTSIGERGVAIISKDGGEQKVYEIGGEIADQVVLDAVMENQVTIKRAGVLESLKLDKAFEGDGADGGSSSGGRTRAAATAGESLLDVVRFFPTEDSRGRFALELRPNRSNFEAFNALGLQEGDILLRVGGARVVGDPSQANKIIDDLMGKKVANIVVERSGASIPLELKLAGGTRFSDDFN